MAPDEAEVREFQRGITEILSKLAALRLTASGWERLPSYALAPMDRAIDEYNSLMSVLGKHLRDAHPDVSSGDEDETDGEGCD